MTRSPEAQAARLRAFQECEDVICRADLYARLLSHFIQGTAGKQGYDLSANETALVEFLGYETENAAAAAKEAFYAAWDADDPAKAVTS